MRMPFMRRRIYLDYAGATPVSLVAQKAYRKALTLYGNPGALHAEGVAAQEALEGARFDLARVFECKAGDLVLTSGATESNNLLIQGVVKARLQKNGGHVHIITTSIEHASILEPVAALEEEGVAVTYLEPDHQGAISPGALHDALTDTTVLVSIGWTNSEIGVVQQMGALARVIREYEKAHGTRIIFHSDAGQAPLYISPVVSGLGVDALTLDSGKLYGPRGVGALILRSVDIEPILHGGGQEGGLRPGTENVALAAGFAAALVEAHALRERETKRLRDLKNICLHAIEMNIPGSVVNGSTHTMLPHVLNVSLPGVDSEYLVMRLDALGVAVATKSACEETERQSHVVYALDPENAERAQTTLRVSFGRATTKGDVQHFLKKLTRAYHESKGAVLRYEHEYTHPHTH